MKYAIAVLHAIAFAVFVYDVQVYSPTLGPASTSTSLPKTVQFKAAKQATESKTSEHGTAHPYDSDPLKSSWLKNFCMSAYSSVVHVLMFLDICSLCGRGRAPEDV